MAADLRVQGGRRGDHGCVDLAGQVAVVRKGQGLVARGRFGSAGAVGIDDGGEGDALGFVDYAAMVLSEGSGADDGYARFHSWPMTAIPAALAASSIGCLSSISVRPASIARTVVLVSFSTGMVARPTTGTSNRRCS